MPFGSVILRPGVNTNLTYSLNEAGVSQSNLIRFKDSLAQKYGGWVSYYPFSINAPIRQLHPWQGLQSNQYLGVGATTSLTVISDGAGTNLTPQTETRNFTPDFSVPNSCSVVTIGCTGSSVSTTYTKVFFNTQISVGSLFLQGAYPATFINSSTFTISASVNNTAAAVVSSGILPIFALTNGSANVTVTAPNNGYTATTGLFRSFIAPTSAAGQTIQGPYQVASVTDSTNFVINLTHQATATVSSTMNAGQAQVVFYRTQGPGPAASGYGSGGYGLGGYGTGVAGAATSTGTTITATDWTMDNWGQTLLACPEDGPIYIWSQDSGLTSADVIYQAPFFNGGIFVSMPQQILVAWRSCQSTGTQNPLLVRWSDAGDYTNWTVSNQTTAGSFTLPTGSEIVGAMLGPTQALIFTDIDAWTMQYVGGTVIFNFNRVGAGCGLIARGAVGVLQGQFFWMGPSQFYVYGGKGVQSIPCTVWDFIFQNLNDSYTDKIRCATNSMFNEVTWYFPSAASVGENDSYVRLNTDLGVWDYGTLARSAFTDASILGPPIGSDPTGLIFQHEDGNDAAGAAMSTSFQTGYWRIQEGEDLAFVDWILPDMKFGTYSGAQTASVLITIYAVNYPGETARAYGPYTFTATTPYLNVRIRARYLSVKVESQDAGSFWRLGRIQYRWAPTGRR